MTPCFPLFIRTLGGLSSTFLSSLESSGNQPLSPTSSTPSKVYPETWLPMNTSQDFLQVPVSRDDRSYRTVYSLFHKTVSETKFRILKILRVQNPFLWEKYKRCGRRFSNYSLCCAKLFRLCIQEQKQCLVNTDITDKDNERLSGQICVL